MMTFEEYLLQKKIDAASYKKHAQEQYLQFEQVFLQMHPKSFTDQKLFLINDLRRSYPLAPAGTPVAPEPGTARPKPKIAIPKKP